MATMSVSQRRRGYQLVSLGCWPIALSMLVAELVTDAKLFIALAMVATFGALGCTIAATANS